MTPADFKALVARTRLSLDGRATLGALLVLVDGQSLENARQQAGCSRQAVQAAIRALTHAAGRCACCGARIKAGRTTGGRSGRL